MATDSEIDDINAAVSCIMFRMFDTQPNDFHLIFLLQNYLKDDNVMWKTHEKAIFKAQIYSYENKVKLGIYRNKTYLYIKIKHITWR